MNGIFRKIRKQLAADNKPVKYMRYAIGEIILIMLGIFFALQMNTWNRNANDRKSELVYLENLQRDLTDQLTAIEMQLEYETRYRDISRAIIDKFQEKDELIIDSTLFFRIAALTERRTFKVIDPTFTDLVSSGNLNLLKNRVFKDELIQYYQELERIEKIFANNNSLLIDQEFISTAMDLSYYYTGFEDEYLGIHFSDSELFKDVNYSSKLAAMSRDKIQQNGNVLALMNAVTFRHVVAFGHAGFLEEHRTYTIDLLEKLRQLKKS